MLGTALVALAGKSLVQGDNQQPTHSGGGGEPWPARKLGGCGHLSFCLYTPVTRVDNSGVVSGDTPRSPADEHEQALERR